MIYFILQLIVNKKRSQGRNSREEPGGKTRSRDHGAIPLTGLTTHGLLTLLLYTT